MLRRLQRGPASKETLIAAVREVVDEPYAGATGRPLNRRFEADKSKLRDVLGIDLVYRRGAGHYEIAGIREPLLDLPDRALEAIAFLQETFEPPAPNRELVQDFLTLLASYLSPARRADLDAQRTALAIAWGRQDRDALDPEVDRALHKGLIERRLIAFDYYSPSHADGLPRRHTVEPWERYFDSVRGHEYLRGYCRKTVSAAHGEHAQHRYFRYRLGRMHNVTVLPDKMPPTPRHTRTYPLIYRLRAEIARRGEVTHHPGIEIDRTEPQEDGSVIVHAETDSPWWAVRTLLHYGPSCEVLGGSDALYMMRRTVRLMSELYEIPEDSP
jgi:predicted DNA-binding transcriptional regulator YafY